MEHLLTYLSIGPIFGIWGVLLAIFMVYYIAFAISLIIGSIYSGFKYLASHPAGESWATQLPIGNVGITLPDGGHPVREEKETKK